MKKQKRLSKKKTGKVAQEETIPTDGIPWEIIKEEHFQKYGYSGTLIRALRIKNCMRRSDLAHALGKRESSIAKLENKDKIGIKLAKDLQRIFSIPDWRSLRNKKPQLIIAEVKKQCIDKIHKQLG